MIQSVERALRIMELLDDTEGGQPLGVLELSRLIGLKQPTVHNFLKTLVGLGYVAQEAETSKYYLAESTRFLGWNGSRKKRLIEVAYPIARRVHDQFNETVLMVVPDRNIRTTVFCIDSSRTLTVRPEARMDSKFYSSATGRCLLCGMTDSELDRVFQLNGLPQPGEWDMVATRADVLRELACIRKQQHAIYCAEGVVAIGIPLQIHEMPLNASLGLFIPEARCAKGLKSKLLSVLLDAGCAIQSALMKR